MAAARDDQREEANVIEVSAREYRRARQAALSDLGMSYRQLKAEASRGQFSSLRARKLWLAIGQSHSA